jgi:hypothetical protein
VKKENKMILYDDGYGHDIPILLRKKKRELRPSAEVKDLKDVLMNCERDFSSLGSWYHLVIMRGASDIPRNEMNYIKTIKETFAAPTCMNVVLIV